MILADSSRSRSLGFSISFSGAMITRSLVSGKFSDCLFDLGKFSNCLLSCNKSRGFSILIGDSAGDLRDLVSSSMASLRLLPHSFFSICSTFVNGDGGGAISLLLLKSCIFNLVIIKRLNL